MPAQLHWPASGGTEPKTALIPCLHLVTWAGRAAEPAQRSRQPCQSGKLTKEYKAVVDCPFVWAFCSCS